MATTRKIKGWKLKHREGYVHHVSCNLDDNLIKHLIAVGFVRIDRGNGWETLHMPGPATDPRVEAFLDEMENYR